MYPQRLSFLRKVPALKATQCFLVLVQIFNAVSVLVDVPLLQETIKLKAGQSEELSGLVVRQRAGTVPFDDQSFKSFTTRVLMLSEIVRDLDRNYHIQIIRRPVEMLNRRNADAGKSSIRDVKGTEDPTLKKTRVGRLRRLGYGDVGAEVHVLDGV
jgi:hypothetical protein